MRKKFLIIPIVLFLSVFTLFGRAGKEQISEKTNPAELQKNSVISLAPNITEIIIALGGEHLLGGVCEECFSLSENKAPKQVSIQANTADNIVNIGSPVTPNLERIISLRPSLVFASSLTQNSFLNSLQKRNIKTLQYNKLNSISDIYHTILGIGKAIGKTSEAERFVSNMEARINEYKSKTASIRKPKTAVYIIGLSSNGLLYAATPDTYIDEIITSAGLINAAKGSFWTTNIEEMLIANPDFIFIADNSSPEYLKTVLKTTTPYSELSGEIIAVNANNIERPGINIYKAVEEMYNKAYRTNNH